MTTKRAKLIAAGGLILASIGARAEPCAEVNSELSKAIGSGKVIVEKSACPAQLDRDTLELIEIINRYTPENPNSPILSIIGDQVLVLDPKALNKAISTDTTATSFRM